MALNSVSTGRQTSLLYQVHQVAMYNLPTSGIGLNNCTRRSRVQLNLSPIRGPWLFREATVLPMKTDLADVYCSVLLCHEYIATVGIHD